eukprot:scaffold2638_cov94-Skeletonema_dohrnii-CCMP3373.AAC.1
MMTGEDERRLLHVAFKIKIDSYIGGIIIQGIALTAYVVLFLGSCVATGLLLNVESRGWLRNVKCWAWVTLTWTT